MIHKEAVFNAYVCENGKQVFAAGHFTRLTRVAIGLICLCLYVIPVWKELGEGGKETFKNTIWHIYFLPAILLAYYYGFKGSLANAIISTAVVLLTENEKRRLLINLGRIGFADTFLMLGLTVLASLCVGFMAEKLRRRERELWRAYEGAIRDNFTGLYNHGYFKERLRFELNRARTASQCLSLVFIDADDFKDINDTYGHPEGDRVLLLLSEAIKANLRDKDVLARYGGDEFVVILPDTDKERSRAIAERLKASIASVPFPHKRLTISVGISTFPEDADSPSDLIQAADDALRRAKKQGKDRVVAAPGRMG
ncbi:MAG: GGDEF domain-containing protein [Firmicutes bacterium]|nr:GGDEF domain-containing protein [Bacillota bacterium]